MVVDYQEEQDATVTESNRSNLSNKGSEADGRAARKRVRTEKYRDSEVPPQKKRSNPNSTLSQGTRADSSRRGEDRDYQPAHDTTGAPRRNTARQQASKAAIKQRSRPSGSKVQERPVRSSMRQTSMRGAYASMVDDVDDDDVYDVVDEGGGGEGGGGSTKVVGEKSKEKRTSSRRPEIGALSNKERGVARTTSRLPSEREQKQDMDEILQQRLLRKRLEGAAPPRPKDLSKVIKYVQQKDQFSIFKNPVTEEQAPGYFQVIETPMDFPKIIQKYENNEYTEWTQLENDLHIMYNNCLAYNAKDSVYYREARKQWELACQVISQVVLGVQDYRAATVGVRSGGGGSRGVANRADSNQARADPSKPRAANDRTTARRRDNRDRNRGSRPSGSRLAARYAAPQSGGEWSSIPYPRRADGKLCVWGGLAGGANAEGLSFVRATSAKMEIAAPEWIQPEVYSRSISLFAGNLVGKARELAMKRAVAALKGQNQQYKGLRKDAPVGWKGGVGQKQPQWKRVCFKHLKIPPPESSAKTGLKVQPAVPSTHKETPLVMGPAYWDN